MLPKDPAPDDDSKEPNPLAGYLPPPDDMGWSRTPCPSNVPERYRRVHGSFALYGRPSSGVPWGPILKFVKAGDFGGLDAVYTGLTHSAAMYDTIDVARRVGRTVLPRFLLIHPQGGLMISMTEWLSFGENPPPGTVDVITPD